MRPPVAPPARLFAVPTVPVGPPEVAPDDVDPVELAVPAELVPGGFILAALPAPLGSLTELLSPPTFPGPVTPLTAAVPAPAEPARGAAPVAPDVPLAEALPADPAPEEPPLPPPPPPPPPLCASADTGDSKRPAFGPSLQASLSSLGRTKETRNPIELPLAQPPMLPDRADCWHVYYGATHVGSSSPCTRLALMSASPKRVRIRSQTALAGWRSASKLSFGFAGHSSKRMFAWIATYLT